MISTLLKRWPLLFICTLLCAAPVGIYCLLAPPIYESSVRLLVQNEGLDIDEMIGLRSDKQFLATQAEIIRSPKIVRDSFDRVQPIEAKLPPAAQMGKAMEELRVSPLEGTEVLKVSYQHTNPEYATNRLRAVVESYVARQRVREQATKEDSVGLLEQQRDALLVQRRELEERRLQLREKNSVLGDGTDGLQLESTALRQLMEQLAAVQAEELQLSQGILASESSDESLDQTLSLVSSDDATTARTLREMRAAVAIAVAADETAIELYGERHANRLRAHGERLAAEGALRQAQQAVRNEAVLRLQRLREQIASLEEKAVVERQRLSEISQDAIREQQLLKEIESVDQQFDMTLAQLREKQLQDSALQAGSASLVIEVLDDFVVPADPAWPLPIPLTGAAALLGFLTAVFFIVWTQPEPENLSRSPLHGLTAQQLARLSDPTDPVRPLHDEFADEDSESYDVQTSNALPAISQSN